jgi:hypothetical protein
MSHNTGSVGRSRATAMVILLALCCGVWNDTGRADETPPWSGGEWSYSRLITISNPGEFKTDYSVRIRLDSANFDFSHALPDFGDIQFSELDGRPVNAVWVEPRSGAERVVNVWLMLDSLSAHGSKSLLMRYGSPFATPRIDVSGVFLFGDDFHSDWDACPVTDFTNFSTCALFSSFRQIDSSRVPAIEKMIEKPSNILYTPNDPLGRRYKMLFASTDPAHMYQPSHARLSFAWAGTREQATWSTTSSLANLDSVNVGWDFPSWRQWGDSIYAMVVMDSVVARDSARIALIATEASSCSTWSRPQTILRASDTPNAAAPGRPVLLRVNGTWYLYYSTWNNDGRQAIFAATSPSVRGPWTTLPAPVFAPEITAPWDSSAKPVDAIQIGDSVYLSYSNQVDALGMLAVAPAADPIDFVKRGSPDLQDRNNIYSRASFTMSFDSVYFGNLCERGGRGIALFYPRKWTPSAIPPQWNSAKRGVTYPHGSYDQDTLHVFPTAMRCSGGVLSLASMQTCQHPINMHSMSSLRTDTLFTSNIAIRFRRRLSAYANQYDSTKTYAAISVGNGQPCEASHGWTDDLLDVQWFQAGLLNSYQWFDNEDTSLDLDRIRPLAGEGLVPGHMSAHVPRALHTNWATHELRWPARTDSSIRWLINDTVRISALDTAASLRVNHNRLALIQGEEASGKGGVSEYDWVVVRKFEPPEPTFALGCETARGMASACTTTVLVNDPASMRDAAVDSIAQTTNYGLNSSTIIGTTSAGSPRDAIVWFDLSRIPSTAQILSASCSVYCWSAENYPMDVSVYPITSDWNESTVTWLQRGTGTGVGGTALENSEWATPGGDFGPPVATLTVNQGDTLRYLGWDVRGAVQSQVSGSNFGLIFRQSSLRQSRTMRISGYLREHLTFVPKLVLQYVVLPPHDLCPGPVIGQLPYSEIRTTSTGVYQYTATDCERVTVTLCGASRSSEIEVRGGSPCPGNIMIAQSDSVSPCGPGSYQSEISFDADSGMSCFILLDDTLSEQITSTLNITRVFCPLPPRPTRLTIRGTDEGIHLRWRKVRADSLGNPYTPNGYLIYRQRSSDSSFAVIAQTGPNDTTYLDTEAFPPDELIFYWVTSWQGPPPAPLRDRNLSPPVLVRARATAIPSKDKTTLPKNVRLR